MRRGSPTQRQGRNHLSQLPPYRRGRRSPRLAQDHACWAKEGKLPLPEDPPAATAAIQKPRSASWPLDFARSDRPSWPVPCRATVAVRQRAAIGLIYRLRSGRPLCSAPMTTPTMTAGSSRIVPPAVCDTVDDQPVAGCQADLGVFEHEDSFTGELHEAVDGSGRMQSCEARDGPVAGRGVGVRNDRDRAGGLFSGDLGCANRGRGVEHAVRVEVRGRVRT